jgi:hypothetical protein
VFDETSIFFDECLAAAWLGVNTVDNKNADVVRIDIKQRITINELFEVTESKLFYF